jgi:hypothetical protein
MPSAGEPVTASHTDILTLPGLQVENMTSGYPIAVQHSGNIFLVDYQGNTYTHGNATVGGTVAASAGLQILTTATQPPCNASTRGTLWFVQGGSGVADSLQLCYKNAANLYSWQTI